MWYNEHEEHEKDDSVTEPQNSSLPVIRILRCCILLKQ